MTHLLDPDTYIEILRGNPTVLEQVQRYAPDDLAVSAITHYELAYGAERCPLNRQEAETAKVNIFLRQIHEIPFAANIARRSARIRATLDNFGMPIGPMDNLIAGTALETGLILVTGNLREFKRIEGIRCVSWT